MITLHRLGRRAEPFRLDPDAICTVEAHPDTVIGLASGVRVVVAETPAEVVAAIRAWRVALLAGPAA